MKPPSFIFLISMLLIHIGGSAFSQTDAVRYVPTTSPRTLVLAGRDDAFRTYVTVGEGKANFDRLKADFDRDWMDFAFPDEPLTYGDPNPSVRDQVKADFWRGAQDVCGRVSGVAEAATLIWKATGEEKYLAKAKAFILGEVEWSLDASGWEKGPRVGATDIFYNDEAHFRLWRKLPLVYDQLRDQFTPDERARIVAHYKVRGERSVAFIKKDRTETVRYNSLAVTPSSHPVRFMPMTGITALALWDDVPEAREWWEFAYQFYATQFPPWGGDNGGWAEGVAYWRGVIEHAAFQDQLLAMGDPSAYVSKFWRNTPYFQVYNVQPYRHTQFGDLSNAGMFNLEPVVAEFLRHLARVQSDGHLLAYADLCTDTRPTPAEKGLEGLDRIYPTGAEFLIRDFIASARTLPETEPLSVLPANRYFSDVGWVSMHSALGRPADDIHVTFLSSPYGSFSHSHAHQNAFVLNAYGENLAITGAYREWHNSPHHEGWTRLTKSKNAILIDGEGQKPKSKESQGKITRFDERPRATWTTGDATAAYALMQPKGRVQTVTRDLIFIDQRYVVIRDVVRLDAPGKFTFLLHALKPIEWHEADATALIQAEHATLSAKLVTAGTGFTGRVQNQADVPVDSAYATGTAANYFTTGNWNEQSHLFAEVTEARQGHVVYAVLWPERNGTPALPLETVLSSDGSLLVTRPDGLKDRLNFTGTGLTLDSQ